MNIFSLLRALVSPLVALLASLVGVFSVIIGAFLNPAGAINSFCVRMIDLVASVWPSTPPGLTLSALIFPATGGTTLGRAFLLELFSTAFAMFAIVLIVKLYKLIPFKAT